MGLLLLSVFIFHFRWYFHGYFGQHSGDDTLGLLRRRWEHSRRRTDTVSAVLARGYLGSPAVHAHVAVVLGVVLGEGGRVGRGRGGARRLVELAEDAVEQLQRPLHLIAALL